MEQRSAPFQTIRKLRLQIEAIDVSGFSTLKKVSTLATTLNLTQTKQSFSKTVFGSGVEKTTGFEESRCSRNQRGLELGSLLVMLFLMVSCANGTNPPSAMSPAATPTAAPSLALSQSQSQNQSQSSEALRDLFGEKNEEELSPTAKRVRQVTDWLKFVRQEKTIAILESTLGPALNFQAWATSRVEEASLPESEFSVWRKLLAHESKNNVLTRDLDAVSLETLAQLLAVAASPDELQEADKLLIESSAFARY